MLADINQGNALVAGAGGGIGLAVTAALSAQAHWQQIIAVSRHASANSDLQALQQKDSRITIMDVDALDENSRQRLGERLSRRAIKLNLVINAIGMLHSAQHSPEKRLADCTAAAMHELFDTNAVAPLLLAQTFAPFFPRRDPAVLVNFSARVGSIGDNRLGGWYAYRAAKAAQNMLTRNLSIELSRRHLGLICIGYHPGTVDTELSRPFQSNVPTGKLFNPPQAAKYLLKVIETLACEDNGYCFDWRGERLPD